MYIMESREELETKDNKSTVNYEATHTEEIR